MRLIERIIASGAGVLADEYDMVWFAGDDLQAVGRPRGHLFDSHPLGPPRKPEKKNCDSASRKYKYKG